MLRYVLGISILTAGIIILRALTDGKILRKHQYALWLAIPIFMIVSPFLKISLPVDTLFPAKPEAVTVAENESKDKKINEAIDLQRPEENTAFKMVSPEEYQLYSFGRPDSLTYYIQHRVYC